LSKDYKQSILVASYEAHFSKPQLYNYIAVVTVLVWIVDLIQWVQSKLQPLPTFIIHRLMCYLLHFLSYSKLSLF